VLLQLDGTRIDAPGIGWLKRPCAKASQPASQTASARTPACKQVSNHSSKQSHTHTDTHTQPQSIDTATEVTMCQQPRGRKESRRQVVQPCSGQMVWQVWAKLLAAVAAPAPPLGNGFAQRARRPAMARGLLVQRKSAVARGRLVPVVARDPLAPVVARGLLAERRSAAQRSLLALQATQSAICSRTVVQCVVNTACVQLGYVVRIAPAAKSFSDRGECEPAITDSQ